MAHLNMSANRYELKYIIQTKNISKLIDSFGQILTPDKNNKNNLGNLFTPGYLSKEDRLKEEEKQQVHEPALDEEIEEDEEPEGLVTAEQLQVRKTAENKDDQTWEVECTEKVLKFLKDNNITAQLEASAPMANIVSSLPSAAELEKLMTMTPD